VPRITLQITLSAAIVALLAAACTTGGGSGGTGGTIDGTSWRLSTYVDSTGKLIPVAAGFVVDATFKDANVHGFSGCNTYTAPTTISGSKLTVGAIATTMRMCKMAIPIEQDYLAALAKSATYTANADGLAIYGADGAQLLGYVPGPADPLEGSWTVTGYNNGKEAFVSPIEGSTLTATFTPDGQVSGSSGCNTYTGTYKLDGTKVTIGPLASTMMACDQALMDQEAQFLTALQTPSTVETSGANVTLRDANGAMQVGLAPATS